MKLPFGWRFAATALAMALIGHGCASVRASRPASSPISRGHEVAQARCGSCHGVDPGAASPQPKAPPFDSSEMRHTAGLDGRVAALTRAGHYAMPPVQLSPGDIDALVQYIERNAKP